MKENEKHTEKSVFDIRKRKSIQVINFIIEDLNLENANQLAEKMGYDRPEKIYKILRGENSISKNFAIEINSKFPQYSIDALRDGNINGLKIGNSQSSEPQPRISFETEKGRPFYNADWTLSFKEVNDDTVFHPEFNIDFPPANKEGVNWFRAKGNSMIEINSGDYVALEKIEDFSWFPLGRIYGIITSNGFRTIKKIVQSDIKENYLLKASNPNKEDHPDQNIPKEMITGLYKIIYVIKDLDE